MVQYLKLQDLSKDDLNRLLRRAEKDIRDLFPLAQEVIDRVRTEGDAAVVEYARKWDAPNFEASMLRATPQDFAAARAALDPAAHRCYRRRRTKTSSASIPNRCLNRCGSSKSSRVLWQAKR